MKITDHKCDTFFHAAIIFKDLIEIFMQSLFYVLKKGILKYFNKL